MIYNFSSEQEQQDNYKHLAMKYVRASGFGCNHYMLNANVMNMTFKVLPVSQINEDPKNKFTVRLETQI